MQAGRGILVLPASLARLPTDAVRGCTGIGLGLFGWAITTLAVQGLINATLYPLVDAHDYQHSWGGPTLAGAWLAHIAVALPCELAALGILRGLTAADQASKPTPSRQRPWWPPVLSVAAVLMTVVLLYTWWQQL
ncbi:hypothetical protein ABZ858_30310 [Streptomyces sp. NPDC047017]|uniref:hypothetical protein n=1 Tax=Streptomyces sp. NPDC047017 TaxID=3155024 RepID=UPI0033FB84B6